MRGQVKLGRAQVKMIELSRGEVENNAKGVKGKEGAAGKKRKLDTSQNDNDEWADIVKQLQGATDEMTDAGMYDVVAEPVGSEPILALVFSSEIACVAIRLKGLAASKAPSVALVGPLDSCSGRLEFFFQEEGLSMFGDETYFCYQDLHGDPYVRLFNACSTICEVLRDPGVVERFMRDKKVDKLREKAKIMWNYASCKRSANFYHEQEEGNSRESKSMLRLVKEATVFRASAAVTLYQSYAKTGGDAKEYLSKAKTVLEAAKKINKRIKSGYVIPSDLVRENKIKEMETLLA
ncbi:hypothetical protein T439DRAFT_324932 [Meredithblackwellia eburnea MCA 4105]